MSDKKLLGYKASSSYIDEYEWSLGQDIEKDTPTTLPEVDEENPIDDLLEEVNKIETIIGTLPDSIGDKLEDIYDQIYDFVEDELSGESYDKVPNEEDWNYKDEETEVDWDKVTDEDVTLDDFNPDVGFEDNDFFPIEKEEHPESEVIEKEYIKNLVDLFEDYNTNLENITSNFWNNFVLASINKDTSEIKMLLDNIVLSSSNVAENAKHLLDNAVRESIIKNMKIKYFATMFNAEETIKHLKQLKAMQELRLRYSKIPEVIGDTKTNQMNNNILKASKMTYDKKYEIAYENLYRYLNSSNKVLDDTLQTYIQEMKSKQILIERKGII